MAKIGERPDIENKIFQISDRIVRGLQAEKDSAIKIVNAYKSTSVVASSLTSIGLSNPLLSIISGDGSKVTVSQAFDAWHGLPKVCSFVGVAFFVITAIVITFYRQSKVEERAILSHGLFDAFKRLEIELVEHLELVEPMDQLSSLYENSVALEKSFYHTMPKRDGCKKVISEYTEGMIKSYCTNWGDALPKLERREK